MSAVGVWHAGSAISVVRSCMMVQCIPAVNAAMGVCLSVDDGTQKWQNKALGVLICTDEFMLSELIDSLLKYLSDTRFQEKEMISGSFLLCFPGH